MLSCIRARPIACNLLCTTEQERATPATVHTAQKRHADRENTCHEQSERTPGLAHASVDAEEASFDDMAAMKQMGHLCGRGIKPIAAFCNVSTPSTVRVLVLESRTVHYYVQFPKASHVLKVSTNPSLHNSVDIFLRT